MDDLHALRIVFTGGGSGGPTTPLLAVYNELHKETSTPVEAVFWGTTGGPEREMAQRSGLAFESIPSGKLRRYWSWQNFLDPLFILAGFGVALLKLLKFRPHVVVSAGSFVSVPVAIAAWLLRIPHVCLQMDAKPGLANRLMAPFSTLMTHLFQHSAQQFRSVRTHAIGPVVRPEVSVASAEKANEQFRLDPTRPVLLVTGGGQGALGLNQAVETVLPYWLERFQVVHLTGKNLSGAALDHPDYHAIPFVSEGMGNLLARSDLVVTRAGMGILGELAILAKDAVLVPIPNSHQELNARLVAEAKGGVWLHQPEFQSNGLAWWKSFLAEHVPGTLGKQLQILLPPGGTQEFASLIREVSQQ